MRKIFLLLAIVLLAPGCADEEKLEETVRTILRIGIDPTYTPFETIDSTTGRLSGFDIDLIEEICKTYKWTPEYVVTPFDRIINGLTCREYDVVISAVSITPGRSVLVDFSDAYFLAGQVLAVPLDDSTTGNIDDLVGKRIGVQTGTTGEMMAKRMDGGHVFSYERIGAAFTEMDSGRLDAVLNDLPTSRAYIERHGNAKMVGEILSSEHYGIAVRRGDSMLLSQINLALENIRSSGMYDQMHKKWFGAVPAQKPPTDSSGNAQKPPGR